jgi:hypothetical protein
MVRTCFSSRHLLELAGEDWGENAVTESKKRLHDAKADLIRENGTAVYGDKGYASEKKEARSRRR